MSDKSAPLPGSASLGRGFDIFGSYDDRSLKTALFNFTDLDDGTETTPSGTFFKPFNTIFNADVRKSDGTTSVFTSREKFQEHFDIKAKVNVKIAFFRGSFDSAFSMDKESEKEYSYGLFE